MFFRLPQNYFAKPFAFLLVGEALAFFIAFYLALLIQLGLPADFSALLSGYFLDGLIFCAAGVGSLFAMGLYHGRNATRFHDVFMRTFLGFGLAFVVLSVTHYLWPSLAFWRQTQLIGLPLSMAGVFLFRYLFHRLVC